MTGARGNMVGGRLVAVRRALRWRDRLLVKIALIVLFGFAIVVALTPEAAWGEPFRRMFRFVMGVFLWVMLWLVAAVIDCVLLWMSVRGSNRRKGIAAACLAAVLTGWFLVITLWNTGATLWEWPAEPIWMRRAHVCLISGSISALILVLVLAVPLPPGRAFRETLRLPTAILTALGAMLLIWTEGLEQRGLIEWIHGVSRLIVPVLMLGVFASFFLFVSLTTLHPQRARRRAYGTEIVPPRCRRCGRRMSVEFRKVRCLACRRAQPLPRAWWICEFGAPLRGVAGPHGPECGSVKWLLDLVDPKGSPWRPPARRARVPCPACFEPVSGGSCEGLRRSWRSSAWSCCCGPARWIG